MWNKEKTKTSGTRVLFCRPKTAVSTLFTIVGLFVIQGCASGVGDPCMPEQIPSSKQKGSDDLVYGYDSSEVYIEASSVQCETRVCGVFQLNGNPSPDCQEEKKKVRATICPSPEEIDKRVYCTCRCKAPDKRFATCDCPSGYECKEVLTKGDSGTRGSYCVKSGTLTKL